MRDDIPSIQWVHCLTQLGATSKLAEAALDSTVPVTNRDVKQHQAQYWPQKSIAHHWSPFGHLAIDHNTPTAAIHSLPTDGPSVKAMSLPFRHEDVVQDSDKRFAQVQADDVCSLIYHCCKPVIEVLQICEAQFGCHQFPFYFPCALPEFPGGPAPWYFISI